MTPTASTTHPANSTIPTVEGRRRGMAERARRVELVARRVARYLARGVDTRREYDRASQLASESIQPGCGGRGLRGPGSSRASAAARPGRLPRRSVRRSDGRPAALDVQEGFAHPLLAEAELGHHPQARRILRADVDLHPVQAQIGET